MKKAKLMMMTLMCLVSLTFFGQEKTNYIKNDVFYTTFETGVGEKVLMEFKIDSADIAEIQETELYKNWDSTTFSNPANADNIQKWKSKSLSHIEVFLMGKTSMASFYAKFELKNKNSYTPINGASSIYCKDGKITILFPMKGQNGYGNFIMSRAFYTIEWVNGKQKTFNFVSTN